MHFTNTAKTRLQLINLTIEHQTFFFGQSLKFTLLPHALKTIQFINPLAHGIPVCQHAAQPTDGDVRHPTAFCFILDSFNSLSFSPHEQYRPAICNILTDQVIRTIHCLYSLLKINNMDPIAFCKNIWFHLGVPTMCPVTKMDAAFQQGFHRYFWHSKTPLRFSSASVILTRGC